MIRLHMLLKPGLALYYSVLVERNEGTIPLVALLQIAHAPISPLCLLYNIARIGTALWVNRLMLGVVLSAYN